MNIVVLNLPSKAAKNVVRDLFYGCWCKGKRIASAEFPPTTLLSIYSVLKETGLNIILCDAQEMGFSQEETIVWLSGKKVDIVIVPTSTMSFNEDANFLLDLKKKIKCKTVLFGSYVTFLPQKALEHESVDFIVKKEPEFALKNLIELLNNNDSLISAKSIGYKDTSGKIIINDDITFVKNLDDFPIMDRIPIQDYVYFNPLVKKIKWTTATTSRGCPGRCNFCTSPTFYGNTFRSNSPERVIEEIKYLIGLGYEEIFYRDETFTGNYKRVENICHLILKENLKISWICSARVNTVDEKLLSLMKEAGCHMIRFGVESGTQEILNKIKKGTTIKQAIDVFKFCNKIGLETHAHVMLGCPGENWDSVKSTIQFVKKLNPTTVTCGAFTPYLGTPIFNEVKKHAPEIDDGSSKDLFTIHNSGYFNSYICDLSDEEVGKAVKLFYRKFYFRPYYILKTLFRIRSLTELRRVFSAGLSVVSYGISKDN